MNLFALVFLGIAAVLSMFDWFRQGANRRYTSTPLILFFFIIGVILIFVFKGPPIIQYVSNK